MVCSFVQSVAPRSSCQTVSLDPETASASSELPGPEASTDVCAGVGGSSSHCCFGPPIVAACPLGVSTHSPPGDVAVAPASPPDVMADDVTGSGADAVQGTLDGLTGLVSAWPTQPPAHTAVSPALARNSAAPSSRRTS